MESDSEAEYSEDEDPDDTELVTFTVDSPDPIRKMIQHLARKHEEMFPKIEGKRRLNPLEFDLSL